MKSSFKIVFLIVLTALAFGAIFIASNHANIDFTDNPALLVDVDSNGIATLDTHKGKVTGKLADISWNNDTNFIAKAKLLVAIAQKDTVAFRTKNDQLTIWYDTESGAKSLNQELGKLSQ
jgi:hypothetical protein